MSKSLPAPTIMMPVLILLTFVPLLTASPRQKQAHNSLGPPLYVQLVDAYTGSPVVGAPVSMDGVPQLKTTDLEGYVIFRKQGSVVGDLATIWTTPTGYAPSSKRVPLSSRVNFTTLYLAPANLFSTGLIDPLVGGVFVFDDFLPTVPPTPFYLKVEVPAGALPEPLSINITPYPTLSLWSHGLPGQAVQFGAVHVNTTDSAGQFASESLNLPVTFTARGYAAGHNLGAYDLSTLNLYRFDYSAHQWVYDSSPSSIDLSNNTFSVQTNHFSILSGCSQVAPQSGGGSTPLLSIGQSGHECEDLCEVPIRCGLNNGNCNVSEQRGSAVSIGASLTAQLNEKYGADAGNDLLGKISAEIGFSFTGSVSTNVSATTAKSVSGGVTQGAEAAGTCESGKTNVYIISKKYSIKVDGIEIGSISVPEKVQVVATTVVDAGCCENPPSYSPTPQPKLPDDCN